MGESKLVSKGPCSDCGSSDACALYDDGHTHCFSCGVTRREGAAPTAKIERAEGLISTSPITTSKRGITPETFAFWRYGEGELKGDRVHVANHYADGKLVGQKIRTATKEFKVLGKLDALYGRWLWSSGGKRVVVTEGEIDALSVSQVLGNRWPVVSVPNGAQGALKAVKAASDWLGTFDEVVFMFDQDEPGQDAAVKCAAALPPGKAKIATLPMKDANDMLKAGKVDELVRAVWNAAEYRPDGIVSLSDVLPRALKPVGMGRAWPWKTLTEKTYGRRDGEVYTLGAGTGIGKTDVLTQCIEFDLTTLGVNVGVLFLEQGVEETVQRLAGKFAGKRFHIPDGSWEAHELEAALRSLESAPGKLSLYDSWGAADWQAIRDRIEYMVQGLGCRHIYLDHLTALAAEAEDERKALEALMAAFAKQAKRLGHTLHLVSHLATPEGKPHEEGGRVMIRHFKGSRAIGFWSHFMFGLERNQQAEDEDERSITTFRILKDRHTGNATGATFDLRFNRADGRLYETDEFLPESTVPGDF